MGGKRLFDMLRRRRYRPARGSVRGVTTKARRAVFASLPSYVRDPSLALRMTVFFLSFWGRKAEESRM